MTDDVILPVGDVGKRVIKNLTRKLFLVCRPQTSPTGRITSSVIRVCILSL